VKRWPVVGLAQPPARGGSEESCCSTSTDSGRYRKRRFVTKVRPPYKNANINTIERAIFKPDNPDDRSIKPSIAPPSPATVASMPREGRFRVRGTGTVWPSPESSFFALATGTLFHAACAKECYRAAPSRKVFTATTTSGRFGLVSPSNTHRAIIA
jgi:hypothetical protein